MFAAATDGGVDHAQDAADGRARDLRLDTDGSQRRGQGRSLSGTHPEYGAAARDLRGHLGDLAFRGGKVIAESDDYRSEHVNLAQRLAGDIENAGERHGRLVATEIRRRTELGDGLGKLQDVVGAFHPALAGALGDGESTRPWPPVCAWKAHRYPLPRDSSSTPDRSAILPTTSMSIPIFRKPGSR